MKELKARWSINPPKKGQVFSLNGTKLKVRYAESGAKKNEWVLIVYAVRKKRA